MERDRQSGREREIYSDRERDIIYIDRQRERERDT